MVQGARRGRAGSAGTNAIIFSPRLGDRISTVTARSSLSSGVFAPLPNPSAPSDFGKERMIIDLGASGAAKF